MRVDLPQFEITHVDVQAGITLVQHYPGPYPASTAGWRAIVMDDTGEGTVRAMNKLIQSGVLVMDGDGDRVIHLSGSQYSYSNGRANDGGTRVFIDVPLSKLTVASARSGAIDWQVNKVWAVWTASEKPPVTEADLKEAAAILGLSLSDLGVTAEGGK